MENNKVITMNGNKEILSIENFPSADSAYEYYTDSIRVLNKYLKNGETVTVIRMRWDAVMTMETINGKN